MRIKYQSADVSEETMRNFAIFLGWSPKVMTTDLSPNVEIDNPQLFTDFIKVKYGFPIQNDLTRFNMQEAERLAELKKEEADEIINVAQAQAQAIANSMFEMTIE